MCYRFTRTPRPVAPDPEIESLFQANEDSETPVLLSPSYNISPTQNILAVIQDEPGKAPRLVSLKWGLVPSFARHPFDAAKLANARSETVHQKPSFQEAFRNKRCLILADGFYEWKAEGSKKVPYFFQLKPVEGKTRYFGFAGIYDEWVYPDGSMKGQKLPTCSIITTEPNSLLAPIHDRMPVILPREDWALWLDCSRYDEEELLSLLKPYPAGDMECWAVSSYVSNPRNEGEKCIEPAKSSKSAGKTELF